LFELKKHNFFGNNEIDETDVDKDRGFLVL